MLQYSVNLHLFRNGSVLVWVGLVWWSVYITDQYTCTVKEIMYESFLN